MLLILKYAPLTAQMSTGNAGAAFTQHRGAEMRAELLSAQVARQPRLGLDQGDRLLQRPYKLPNAVLTVIA